MSCNYHVRQALLKTAAKKRFKNVLRMKEQFRLYLDPIEEEEEELCWCGEEYDYCDHCGDCERFSNTDIYPNYIYCPSCGIEM